MIAPGDLDGDKGELIPGSDKGTLETWLADEKKKNA